MATFNVIDRQHVHAAVIDLGITNIGASAGFTVALPPGAELLRITAHTVTAFNGTTNTLTIGDGTTTFVNAVDTQSTGSETVANVPKLYVSGGTLAITMAQTGTATAGRAVVTVEYAILGNGNAGIYAG